MNISLLDAELRRDEGVRYVVYRDTKNIPTCGVGHNCLASPLPESWTLPLTDSKVAELLNHDLTVTFAGLDLHLPWWRQLDDVRQRVIANMAFNLGVDKLLTFRNTLAAVRAGSYHVAAENMRKSLWASQVGKRAERLIKAMESGEMPA